MTPNGTPRNHADEIANARRGEQTTICDDCGNSNLAHNRAVWTVDGASYCPTCRNLNAREQHKPTSPADLPHYAGLRDGEMVESKRGLPIIPIIAGAIFTLVILGAWQ